MKDFEILKLERRCNDIGNSGDPNNDAGGYIGMHVRDYNEEKEIARIAWRNTNTGVNPTEQEGKLEFYTREGTGTNTSALRKRMTINYDGNVGIGTPSPIHQLADRGNMRLGNGTTAEQDINFVNNVGNWQVGINNAGNGTNSNQFYIYDSAYRLTVQNGTGNVGIGKTNPSSKLDVNGEIKCSSLTVNGVAITTNGGGGGGSSNDGISITTSGSATNSGTSVSANMGIWSSTYAYIDLLNLHKDLILN